MNETANQFLRVIDLCHWMEGEHMLEEDRETCSPRRYQQLEGQIRSAVTERRLAELLKDMDRDTFAYVLLIHRIVITHDVRTSIGLLLRNAEVDRDKVDVFGAEMPPRDDILGQMFHPLLGKEMDRELDPHNPLMVCERREEVRNAIRKVLARFEQTGEGRLGLEVIGLPEFAEELEKMFEEERVNA